MDIEFSHLPTCLLTDDVILRCFLDIDSIRDYVIENSDVYISDLINRKDDLRFLVLRAISILYPTRFPDLVSYGGTCS
jgi:hypothetical protein